MGTRSRRPAGFALCVVLCLLAVLLPAGAAAHRVRPGLRGRVAGTFTMSGVITRAVNVRGEHRGQRITRRWRFRAADCRHGSCARLTLHRQRGDDHGWSRIVLHRTARGRYLGHGSFAVPLRCGGRIHRRGASAPYRIELTVTQVRRTGHRLIARRISARYVNRRRVDHTRCPLGPSHDAARYTGVLTPG